MVKFTVNFPVLGDAAVAGSKIQGKVHNRMEFLHVIFILQSRSKTVLRVNIDVLYYFWGKSPNNPLSPLDKV